MWDPDDIEDQRLRGALWAMLPGFVIVIVLLIAVVLR